MGELAVTRRMTPLHRLGTFMQIYEAVREWKAKLTPALAEDPRRRRRGKAGCSWYIDETYIKVEGR